VLGAIVAIGALLRVPGTASRSLWLDELVSWRIASAEGVGELWRRSSIESVTPPLSFWCQRACVRAFGRHELSMRLPSLVFGLLGIVAIYALGRALLGGRAGLAGAALSAVIPAHVFFSQDGRPYALAALMGALATWCLVLADRRRSWRWLIPYAGALLALVYTHHVAWLVVAAHATWVVFAWWPTRVNDRRLLAWAVSVAAVAVLSAPLVPNLMRLTSRRAGLGFVEVVPRPTLVFEEWAYPIIGLALLGSLVLTSPWWIRRRLRFDWRTQDRRGLGLLAAWALVPAGVLLGLALAGTPTMFHRRYLFLFSTPGVLLAGFAMARFRPSGIGVVALVGTAAALAIGEYAPAFRQYGQFTDHGVWEDWRACAGAVEAHGVPDARVVLRSGLVESGQVDQAMGDARRLAYLRAPVGTFYWKHPPEAILLPRQPRRPEYDAYYRTYLFPDVRAARWVWLIVRLDEVSDTREWFERTLTQVGVRLVPAWGAQWRTVQAILYRVVAPTTTPSPWPATGTRASHR